MKKDVRSVHNEDVRRFAEGAQPTIKAPAIAYGRAFAGAGAFVTVVIILTLAVPATMGALRAPPPLADVRAAMPTAAVVAAVAAAAPAAPAAPKVPAAVAAVPPTPPAASDGPGYRQLPPEALAAGWTPKARDLQIAGGSWYLALPERAGPSCRIRVVTGSEPGGAAQTADVWADCGQVEVRP